MRVEGRKRGERKAVAKKVTLFFPRVGSFLSKEQCDGNFFSSVEGRRGRAKKRGVEGGRMIPPPPPPLFVGIGPKRTKCIPFLSPFLFFLSHGGRKGPFLLSSLPPPFSATVFPKG